MLENLFSFWVIICLGLAGIYFYNARKYLNMKDKEKLNDNFTYKQLCELMKKLGLTNDITYPDNPRVGEFSYLGD